MPTGTSRNVLRTTVRPAMYSRMAASRCPSKTESTTVNGQYGEVFSVRMP